MDNPDVFLLILAAISGLLDLGWRFLRSKWAWLDKTLEQTRLDEIAEAAATDTYEAFVRDLKRSADDGKLTPGEKKEAMSRAVQTFRDLAQDDAISEAKSLATPVIKSLVERAVSRLKNLAS